MSLPRLRLEGCLCENGIWLIDTEQAHHLVHVRRCSSGSHVEGLLDGVKIELKIICDGDTVRAAEISRKEVPSAARELHLLLAVLKNDQFDEALRFAAETGVHTVHLLACERSVPQYSGAKINEKMLRWNRILDEATKQAGSSRPPRLIPPVKPAEIDTASLPSNRLAALLLPGAINLGSYAAQGPVAVAIGPEGDWAQPEIQFFLDNGFLPVSLGESILRASTAVAVSCGCLMLSGLACGGSDLNEKCSGI